MCTWYISIPIAGRVQNVDLLRRSNVPPGDRLPEGAGGAPEEEVPQRAEREHPGAEPEEGQGAAEQVRRHAEHLPRHQQHRLRARVHQAIRHRSSPKSPLRIYLLEYGGWLGC